MSATGKNELVGDGTGEMRNMFKTIVPIRGMNLTVRIDELDGEVRRINKYSNVEYEVRDATADEIIEYKAIAEEKSANATRANARDKFRQEVILPAVKEVLAADGRSDRWAHEKAEWLLREMTPESRDADIAQAVAIMRNLAKPAPRKTPLRDIPLDNMGWRGGDYV